MTTAFFGTSLVTTVEIPITALSPILTPPKILALLLIET